MRSDQIQLNVYYTILGIFPMHDTLNYPEKAVWEAIRFSGDLHQKGRKLLLVIVPKVPKYTAVHGIVSYVSLASGHDDRE